MWSSWFILALIAGFFSVIFNSINRTYLKGATDSTSYAWWFETLRALFFAGLLLLDFRLTVSASVVVLLIVNGVVEFIAIYFFMKMHSVSTLSFSTIITQLRVLLVPILAFLLVGERLQGSNYLGLLLLFVGISLTASIIAFDIKDNRIRYAVAFSLASAISSVITKQVLHDASIPVVMFFFSLPSVLLLPLFMKSPGSRLWQALKSHAPLSLIAACANILTLIFLGYAYKVGTVSQITAVFLSMFVVNVLYGSIVLHEKLKRRQYIGALIVLVAIYLLR